MSWKGLDKFLDDLEKRQRKVIVGTTVAAFQSIVEGSPITGAPGQPVDTSNLKTSWKTEWESREVSVIYTVVTYAPPVEDGVNQHGTMQVRSQVGGFHSVKLTVANGAKLVEHVTKNLGG